MPSATTSSCPGCGKPSAAQHRPFCSQGCRDRDLLQWLSDGHRLPGPEPDEEEDGALSKSRTDGLDS